MASPQILRLFTVLVTFIAGGCSTDHSQDAAPQSHVSPEAAHRADSTAQHRRTHAQTDPPPTDLSPFQIDAPIIDGTTLPGGDSMVLIVDIAPRDQAEPRALVSGLVMFLQRLDTPAPPVSDWSVAVGGQFVRSERLQFTGPEIHLRSVGGTADEGFSVEGELDWDRGNSFSAEITREVQQRMRIQRETDGAATSVLLAAHSQLHSYRWNPSTWSIVHMKQDMFHIGIPTPSEAVASPAGEWRSVTLNGPVQRNRWTMNSGRYQRTSLPAAAGKEGPTDQGAYAVGELGELTLTSDEAVGGTRSGTINPSTGGAVVFRARADGRFSNAAYWWRSEPAAETIANPGTWAIWGRSASSGPDAESRHFTGEIALDADGALSGHLDRIGTSDSYALSGRIDQFTPAGGALKFEIPVSAAEGQSVAPHSHSAAQ